MLSFICFLTKPAKFSDATLLISSKYGNRDNLSIYATNFGYLFPSIGIIPLTDVIIGAAEKSATVNEFPTIYSASFKNVSNKPYELLTFSSCSSVIRG